MSFALSVKEEIISHEFDPIQQQAFLSGFIRQNGEFILSNKHQKLRLTTISNRIARALIAFIKPLFKGELEVAIVQAQTLKKQKTFQITLIGDLENFLQELSIPKLGHAPMDLPEVWVSNDTYFRAYISGVFCASGSVNSPTTSNYHLELQFKSESEALQVQKLLENYDFHFKFLARNSDRFILYLKQSMAVSDFLKFMDASQHVLEFENERISRDMINNINRISNIDIANQSKVLKAGTDQVAMIKYLQHYKQLEALPPKALALAKIRLKKPELSYTELEQEMAKLGFNVTKSGIAYLFKIIAKHYEELLAEVEK